MKKTILLSVFLCSTQMIIAQIFQGTATLSSGNNMDVIVTLDSNAQQVEIELTGPNSQWHAVGFGGNNMSGTYSIIVDGTGSESERKLGFHNSGTLLTSSFTSTSTSTSGTIRTTTVNRARVGSNSNYYTFPNGAGSITLIWAKGSGSSLSNHGSSNRGSTTITLSDICNIPPSALPDTSICEGDSVMIFGKYRSIPGIYVDTAASILGCDSILSQELKNIFIDTSVTTTSTSITSNDTSASYQWYNCDNNSIVSGETSQSYSPSSSGNYSVILTKNGCKDTSKCVFIKNDISIEEGEAYYELSVYPNPANNVLMIDGLPHTCQWKISLYNELGEMLYTDKARKQLSIPVQNIENGVHILIISNSSGALQVRKVVILH